jgi:hypothetical protein
MNTELPLVEDTRSLEERLNATIEMALKQIAQERKSAREEDNFFRTLLSSN